MKLFRYSAPLFILCAVLAACGGGGGGGGVTPPGGGGGGGGGGTPTPSPSHSSSPTPTPTVTPTSTPTPNGSAIPADPNFTVNAAINQENPAPVPQGAISWYNAGTTAHWTPPAGEPPVVAFGDTSASPANDANGFQDVDGTHCGPYVDTQMPYAVHSWVGIWYYNSNTSSWSELQLPSAIGMDGPIEPTQGVPQHPHDWYEVEQWTCEYNIHTHDFSGLVHVVNSTNPLQNVKNPQSPFGYTLKDLLDIWGVTYSANGISIPGNNIQLSGPVAIYYGTDGGNYQTNSYVQVSDPTKVPLAWHDTAIIVVGPGLPTLLNGDKNTLPTLSWQVEY